MDYFRLCSCLETNPLLCVSFYYFPDSLEAVTAAKFGTGYQVVYFPDFTVWYGLKNL